MGQFHTSAAWKMLYLTITADSSDLALHGNWTPLNQFSCLHFKDQEKVHNAETEHCEEAPVH